LKDDTFTSSSLEIHAPRYGKEYEDFGSILADYKGELIIKDLLMKEMYDKFKDEKTTLGVTLDKCIKGGIDKAQLGDDWIEGKVGLLFGDAECVTKFKGLMHAIIVARHGNPKLPHPPPNLDGSKRLDHTVIDESYVISTRVKTGRSISGFELPPIISADRRKDLGGIVVQALSILDGDLKGTTTHWLARTLTPQSRKASTRKRRNDWSRSTSCSRSQTRRCCFLGEWSAIGRTPVDFNITRRSRHWFG
jgi:hypothetical protein